MDDAAWALTVSHYDRWANIRGNWGWVSGPLASPAYHAPALVMFVGADNFQISVGGRTEGGVAWFPRAPFVKQQRARH